MYGALRVAFMVVALLLTGWVPPAAGADQASAAATVTIAAGTLRAEEVVDEGPYGYQDFVRTGDTFWTSSGSQTGRVFAFSGTGEELGAVSGLSSTSIAASVDESVLYSASFTEDSIAAIDPATRRVTDVWPVNAGPLHLVATGNLIFYSWGHKPSGSTGGIAVLNRSTGASTPLVSTTAHVQLDLRGDTLLAYNTAQDKMWTYRVNGAGLTPLASRDLRAFRPTLSPDGTQVLGYHYVDELPVLRRIDSATLATRSEFRLQPTSEVRTSDVTWSPDGARYAVSFSSYGTDDALRVFDASSDALVSRSQWPGATSSRWHSLSRIAFSKTQPVVLGFGSDHTYNQARFVTGSTRAGIKTGLGLSVTNPQVYGGKLRVKVKATGCASTCKVRFTLKDSIAGSKSFSRTLTSGAKTFDLVVEGNGTLKASTPADLRRLAVSRTGSYQVPAKLAVKLTGSYRLSGSTAVYSGGKPTVKVTVAPKRRVSVKVATQRKVDGAWTTVRTSTVKTSSKGVLTYTSDAKRNSTHRLVLRVLADDLNAKSAARSTRALRWT